MKVLSICAYCGKQNKMYDSRPDMCVDCYSIYNRYRNLKHKCMRGSFLVPNKELMGLQTYYVDMKAHGFKVPREI